ncbi:MAG: hypothetical protein CMJ81_14990 [Planctomycetaceae bacterium]|mgnify:CR=1 FL=1|jgi:hypothetical protein|nr:hypothetical protein [Planctomycetaceae bacterium]MBP61816.1 hypothetical protein [Planctomycetaceae bacterium]
MLLGLKRELLSRQLLLDRLILQVLLEPSRILFFGQTVFDFHRYSFGAVHQSIQSPLAHQIPATMGTIALVPVSFRQSDAPVRTDTGADRFFLNEAGRLNGRLNDANLTACCSQTNTPWQRYVFHW